MTDEAQNNRGWFKKGVSGNPKGRPKGARNKSNILEEIVNALVPVTENGKRKMITKREAALIQLANKAASGDLSATKMLEDIYGRHCKENPFSLRMLLEPSASIELATEEGAKNLAELLFQQLYQRREVTENGQVVSISALEAIFKSMILNDIRKGSDHTLKLYLEAAKKLGDPGDIKEPILFKQIVDDIVSECPKCAQQEKDKE